MWTDFWKVFDRKDDASERPSPRSVPALPAAQSTPAQGSRWPRWQEIPWPLVAGLVLAGVALYLLYRRLKPPLTATAAYARLRHRLGKRGSPLAESVPPLAVQEHAATRYPAAAEPTAKVIAFYLRESFGGQDLEDAERAALETALQAAEKGIRNAG